MPSPFPGMDPYLEHPDLFPDLHDRFVIYLSEFVQLQLPEFYVAPIARRTWIEFSDHLMIPDVAIQRTKPRQGEGATAVLEPQGEVITVHVPLAEISEPLVEIYVKQNNERRLVTAIELLSPSNKKAGAGRDLYVRKQQEIVGQSQVHLVEIDLLRSGEHTTAIPERAFQTKVAPCDYHVCVHRYHEPEEFLVTRIMLEQPLPKLDIPLLREDGHITIDLQAVFNRCYDAGPYRREIDYDKEFPVPPLSEARAAWSAELLRRV